MTWITTLDDLSMADYNPDLWDLIANDIVRVAMEAATLEWFGLSPYEIYGFPND